MDVMDSCIMHGSMVKVSESSRLALEQASGGFQQGF